MMNYAGPPYRIRHAQHLRLHQPEREKQGISKIKKEQLTFPPIDTSSDVGLGPFHHLNPNLLRSSAL